MIHLVKAINHTRTRWGPATDLCLAQECVGQLDLGVVQNIKVLTGLGQGYVELLLEP